MWSLKSPLKLVAIFCMNYVLIRLIVDLNVNKIILPQIPIVSLIFLTYSKLTWAADMHTVGYLERVKLHLTCLHPGYQRHLKHLYRAQSRHARKKWLVSMVTCKMVGKVDREKNWLVNFDWSLQHSINGFASCVPCLTNMWSMWNPPTPHLWHFDT